MPRAYKWEFKTAQRPDSALLAWLYKNYVLECPVPGVSVQGKTFRDLGWKDYGFMTLEAQIKKQSTMASTHWKWLTDTGEEFIDGLKQEGIDEKYTLNQEFAIYAKGNRRKIAGLFYLIRNALAHGSFRFHNAKAGHFLALETRNNERLRGRALLRVDSLRAWKTLLNESGEYIK